MTRRFLVDAGPLVALLNERDEHHGWARDSLAALRPPLFTCDAVVTEACHLLRRDPRGPAALLELVARGLLVPQLALLDEAAAIRKLMLRYENVPMSLADACLVRMTELRADSVVVTLDRDFRVYRRNGRQVVPVLSPRDR